MKPATLYTAAAICDEIALEYKSRAGDRDNPEGYLDGAAAAGAEECAKKIRELARQQEAPAVVEPPEDDIPF